MTKKILWCLFLGLVLCMPNIVRAECSVEEKVRLKKIASNIAFTYDYKLIPTNTSYYGIDFSITISNLHPDIYIKDVSKNAKYYNNQAGEITKSDYSPGLTAEFEIYSNYNNCKNERLLTNYVTLPYYNPYYTDPLCEGIEDYKLCGRWNRIQLTYEQFAQDIKNYKESLNKKPQEENPTDKDEFIDKLIYFLGKYGIFIYGTIIVVCGSLIFYLNRKDDFDLK